MTLCDAMDMTEKRPAPSSKAIALGRRIAQRREQKEYSQEELAAMLGVTRGAVGQYETAKSTPRAHKLQRIAEVLGVTVAWLLTGDDPEEKVRAQTTTELAALELIRELSPDQQAAAMAMLKGLAGQSGKN